MSQGPPPPAPSPVLIWSPWEPSSVQTWADSHREAFRNTSSPACSVAQPCLTLYDPVDCILWGSSWPWDFLGKNTGAVAVSFSRGSSWPRDRAHISCLAGGFFTRETSSPTVKSQEARPCGSQQREKQQDPCHIDKLRIVRNCLSLFRLLWRNNTHWVTFK